MMYSEEDQVFKMNAHHVPLRQEVEEITLVWEGVGRGGARRE
jgi:hypothetical protein